MTTAVIDLGMGNVGSVANMLRKIGVQTLVATDPKDLADADRIVLPGVGAFDEAMDRIADRGFLDALNRHVVDQGVPLLGICLGMQLLASSSDEGERAGLGWIPGHVERLPSTDSNGPLKIPHMGWSTLCPASVHPVTSALSEDARFYFVHSYAFKPVEPTHVLATAFHGTNRFVAAVGRGAIVGVQFHAEKSHRHGMALLRRFQELVT